MSDKGVYRDESRIRHMCNALEKVVEKSRGIHRTMFQYNILS